MTENKASTSTRVTHRIDNWAYDFTEPLDEETNDADQEQPLTVPLAEPEEIPEESQVDPVKKRRRTRDHLPQGRVTGSMNRRLEEELEPHQRENIVNAFAAAVKAFAARTSGPDIKKALESALRDQWIIAMADEILKND